MRFKDQSRDYKIDIAFDKRVPAGDNRVRSICTACGFIDYINPKIVAGVVAVWENKILMCRRAIEPRIGFWTLPAGFMEQNETVAEGACREANEEAKADIEIDSLIGIYNVAHLSQVHIFYRAKLRSCDIASGAETAQVALMAWDDIPWQELAFPTVYWALQHYDRTRSQKNFAPFGEPKNWAATPGFENIARRMDES